MAISGHLEATQRALRGHAEAIRGGNQRAVRSTQRASEGNQRPSLAIRRTQWHSVAIERATGPMTATMATSRAERAPCVCVCACLQHLVAMKAAADKAAADKAAVDKALADNAQPDAQLAAAIAASLGLSVLFTPPTPSWAADTAFKGRVSKAESERSSHGHLQDLSRGTPTERRAITFNPAASMRQATRRSTRSTRRSTRAPWRASRRGRVSTTFSSM